MLKTVLERERNKTNKELAVRKELTIRSQRILHYVRIETELRKFSAAQSYDHMKHYLYIYR
jgi:hypothetical protein